MNTHVKIYSLFQQIMNKDGKIQNSDLEKFCNFLNFNKKRNLIQSLNNLRLYSLKDD